jgi:hypothetical protein
VKTKMSKVKSKPTFAANFLGGAYTEIGGSFKSLTINFERSVNGELTLVNPRNKKSNARKSASHSFLKIRMKVAAIIVKKAFKRITFSFN